MDRGYIKKATHPTLPLSIYNYSEKCQYEGYWTSVTLMCRGLILDEEGNIAGRPLGKFFNLGEPSAPPVPDEGFEVQEKLDGSLIIVIGYEGEMVVSSRGSFNSWYRHAAEGILREKYPLFHPHEDRTYLFELIHPSNRIVVDYGERRDLVHLTTIRTSTGEEEIGFPRPERFDYSTLNLPENEEEGYVIRFDSGLRMKVKNSWYVDLHKAKFGTTEKSIWQMLQEYSPEESRDRLIEITPDEIHPWIRNTIEDITTRKVEIESTAVLAYKEIQDKLGDADTKEYALEIKKRDPSLQHLLFSMMRGKPYEDSLWKLVKPKKEEDERHPG